MAVLDAGPERDALRGEVIEQWVPVAERLATRFRDRGEEAEDLRQVAVVGLIKAVDRFDPAKGSSFLSFAVPTVTGEIKRHFRDHLWGLHVPRRVQELRARVRAACGELAVSVDDRGPRVADVARHTGLPEEDVLLGLEALHSYSTLSLDLAPPGSDGHSLLDTLGLPDDRIDLVLDREAAKPCLRCLPDRERAILYLRYFRGMTQGQIADRLGLSQMHVSRLLSSTCEKVRAQVQADG
ncbi:SigB/SigF/SigG family RNA polymerase sigma factor [Streptantibioticus silvisoli]